MIVRVTLLATNGNNIVDCFFVLPSVAKTVVIPAQSSLSPLPLILPDLVRQSIRARHIEKVGAMPDLGVYEIEECFSGPSGILFTPDLKVVVAPDLAGRYFQDTITAALIKSDESNLIVKAYNGRLPIEDAAPACTYVALGTTGYGVYGHWLLDILPRAWCFLRYAESTGLDIRSVKFLLPAGTPGWAFTMLSKGLAIKQDQVLKLEDTKMTRIRRLLVPSLLRREDLMSPHLNDFITDLTEHTQLGNITQGLPERIYISRQNVKSLMSRVTNNEIALEQIAVTKGYTLLNPALLPWHEQIEIFMAAKCVVGPFGSGLHNTIFSPSATVSLVLGAAHMNWFQTCISALRSQRMAYLFPKREERLDGKLVVDYDEGEFTMALDELSAFLDKR